MVDRNLLEKAGDLHYYVTDAGVTWFEMQGIALACAKEGNVLCKRVSAGQNDSLMFQAQWARS
jgi:hypothetical protein